MGRGIGEGQAAARSRRAAAQPIEIAAALKARDDASVLRALLKGEVKFIVVGGMALRSLGGTLATRDLDITPARSSQNLKRLAEVLNTLGAQVRKKDAEYGEPTTWTVASLRGRKGVAMVTPKGILDLAIVPQGTTGYGDLIRRAETRSVAGMKVPVTSNPDLQRMKRARDLPRDREAVEQLRRLEREQ